MPHFLHITRQHLAESDARGSSAFSAVCTFVPMSEEKMHDVAEAAT